MIKVVDLITAIGPMVDLSVTQTVLFSLSISLILFNFGVIVYTSRNRAVNTELGQSRPFTKRAMQFIRRIVMITTGLCLTLVGTFYYRGLYTIPYLEENAPTYIRVSTIVLYCLTFSIGITPAAIMLHLTTALVEIDARKKQQVRARLRMREEALEHRHKETENGG